MYRSISVVLFLAFLSPQISALYGNCDSCISLLRDVQKSLPGVLIFTEATLHATIEAVCGNTILMLKDICVQFETGMVHELFKWINQMERKIDPARECVFLRFCPQSSTPSLQTSRHNSTPIL
ncbi:unnamed protein product [Cylicocyclus nassatus]|uniref:Saposin B-type domain-containing protein n=1 Tax=Cylicocyclus nassatus TaxID=53992 RepID=A0AA36MC52_CYLNA|nr:unnamed protein product [Cylicocyclus nassatus]